MLLSTYVKRLMAITALLFYCSFSFSQSNVSLTDGRSQPDCRACRDMLESWPKEVLFGISINKQGEVFFSMTGGPWFDQLFKGPQDGIAVDLVTKDQFDCRATTIPTDLPWGRFLPPVYLADLKKNMLENNSAHIAIKLGVIPESLKSRYAELEGDLTLIKNGVICYHTFFADIDRSVWELLPMGLYGDTLISTKKIADTRKAMEKVCDRKVQFVVPFAKGKTTFSPAFLQHLPDSLQLSRYYIKSIDLEAFTSVEGPAEVNEKLGTQRIEAVEATLQSYIKQLPNIIPFARQNWDDFYRDIEQTPLASLSQLSWVALTEKLLDKNIKRKLESVLKHHRKVIITFYLDDKTRPDTIQGNTLAAQFKQALTQNNIYKASMIQEEVIERVADSRLPAEYMDSLETPQEKPYITLLADKATYRYQYGLIDQYQALENFKTLVQIDPSSVRVRYNICSLTFNFWQHDTAFVDPVAFLEGINTLYRLKVDSALVRRMLINYHIVSSEHSMHRADYAAKDRSVDYIVSNYAARNLSDEEMLTVAKYLCFYSQTERAIPLVERLVKHQEVSEDLLFYYINMKLFEPYTGYGITMEAELRKAATLNRPRFCKLFYSTNNGGASFQLLNSPALKSLYCEYCK